MKTLFNILTLVFAMLMTALVGELTAYSLTAMGISGVSFATASGLLAKLANDPQMWQKWEKLAFKQGEHKTEFNESEIGVTFADDGPKPSDRVAAAPILYYEQLEDGGHKANIRYKNPIFNTTEAILNKGRYHDQARTGAEHKMDVQHFQAIVDKWHFGVREDDIETGHQNTANMEPGTLMKMFVDEISDQKARKMDTGFYFAMFAGYDVHHFINAGLRAGSSNGAVPVKDAPYGLNSTMSEHPNTYVWHKTDGDETLEAVTYNATPATFSNNISTAVSKITDAAVPTLNLVRKINRITQQRKMIPCQIRLHDGKLHPYFLVMVPGKVKDLLENDTNYFKLMSEAHQGIIDKNPLLRAGDVMYKNLIIRESTKLDDVYFSLKSSFIAAAGTDATAASFNLAGDPVEASIAPGVRQFASGSAALTAFGQANTQVVGRILVMGANAGIRVPGKKHSLKYMEQTDYGLNEGVGMTHTYGQGRVSKWKVGASGLEYEDTPQSFQILVYQGEL